MLTLDISIGGQLGIELLMETYSYSEAKQKLSSVLDEADSTGKVLIRRRDGRMYSLVPEHAPVSPLDVPCVEANISTEEVVSLIRSERVGTRGYLKRNHPLIILDTA